MQSQSQPSASQPQPVNTRALESPDELEEKHVKLSDDSIFAIFGHPISAGGVPRGEAGAMSCTSSRASIRLICETLSTLPIHLYRKQGDGARERASDHPAERIVARLATPWTTAAEFRRSMTYRAIHEGVAYARVIRARGKPRELQQIAKSAVERLTDSTTGEPSYKVRFEGQRLLTLGYEDMVEIRPLEGRSITNDASEAIALALVLEKHASKLFQNSARPSGVIKVEGKLSKAAADRIKASWNAGHGAEKSGGTAVLEEGVQFETISLNSTDAQHLENRRYQTEEIARAFGIPPILIGDYGRATWNNSEAVGRIFLQYCVLAWLRLFEDAFSKTLLTVEEQENHFFEFSADSLTKGDIAGRFEAFSKAVGGPWLSADEVRRSDNRPPIDGGDVLRTPLNTEPAGASTDE